MRWIRAAMAARVHLTPDIASDVLQRIFQPSDQDDRLFTSRQRDILQLIALGKRKKEIAAMLDISVRTVERH
jgi:DNA-binding NarL/FixJ family response regulator